MTNIDALRGSLSQAHGIVLDDIQFEKALLDSDLEPIEEYTKLNAVKINQAKIILYDIILAGANFSEGSINYSIDKTEVRKLRDELKGGKIVRGISPW